MNSLIHLLYVISTMLLVPVILALLGFLAWSLFDLGGIVQEWRERRQGSQPWQNFLLQLRKDHNPPALETVAAFFDTTDYPGFLAAFAQRGKTLYARPLDVEKLVADLEIEVSRPLASLTLRVRLAPMLGLMGTLIPMGPALMELSKGNMGEMSTNLVVAFSMTVLGLFVSGLCYAMALFRRRWYSQDLSDIEYLSRCLCGEGDKP